MNIVLSIILSLLLAMFALIKKAMTYSALGCAFIFSCIISHYGGLSSYLILVFVFLGTVIASKIGSKRRKEINSSVVEKAHKKDVFQILANAFSGTFTIILYALTRDIIFLVVYACVMAESLADSLASDIGVLSKENPVNILTFKRGEKGVSGNISKLGLFASFIGSLVIGIIFLIFNHNLIHFIIVVICGFVGALFDSVFGACFQVKYKCSKCGKLTEKKEHCSLKTEYYKGLKLVNNDMVNFLSNVITCLMSFVLLSL